MRGYSRSERFPLVLRTSLGFAALGAGSSVCGSGVVFLLLALQGMPSDVRGGQSWTLLICAGAYVAFAVVSGSLWTAYLQRRTAVWFVLGRVPSAGEAQRALRIPIDMAVVAGTLWLVGTVLLTSLAGGLGSARDALVVGLTVGLGGLTTVGLTYLSAERVARSIMRMALAVAAPQERLPVTVLTRLVLTWALASGVPLLGVLLVAAPPDLGRGNRTYSLILLAAIGLVLGAGTTVLLARAVGMPLHELRLALNEIARGNTELEVTVNDSSEIGMLQASVNDMVSGLREQDRMRDLFGRHVGADVARHALEHGASLSGDVRHVSALFVDVVDSTALAYQIPPEELVHKLNRLFTSVVHAVSTHGGLVNKFQGDAALCVFGAPTRLADSAASALAAAREIRDAVHRDGELDLGIGLAAGPAFAGQLGTSSRFEYTVIGDAVNEAARLTDDAKEVSGRILASEAVIEACDDPEQERWRLYGPIELRGRKAATVTWVDES